MKKRSSPASQSRTPPASQTAHATDCRERPALRGKSSDGFILVAVLWILGGLAVLATIYVIYVVNAATSLQVNNDRIQAEASIAAATELAAYYLSAAKLAERPTSGAFNFRVGGTEVAVGFRSEAARIDLNSAPKPLIAGLFTVLGAQSDAADDYADRIIGWRTAASPGSEDQDKEVTAYRNAGLSYKPRQAPFSSVQELWLVLGLPKDLIAHALPFVTIFNGAATVNVMDAAPEVVAALPGMTPDRLDAVLKQRSAAPADAPSVLQVLGPVQGATAKGTASTRLAVRVDLANGRRVAAEAVILLLEDADEPYRVLSWTDDFDG
jgi:general secretion pathway protein K